VARRTRIRGVQNRALKELICHTISPIPLRRSFFDSKVDGAKPEANRICRDWWLQCGPKFVSTCIAGAFPEVVRDTRCV
jgi:hypothetical protein